MAVINTESKQLDTQLAEKSGRPAGWHCRNHPSTHLKYRDCRPEDIVKVLPVTNTLGVFMHDLSTIALARTIRQHAKLTPKQVHPKDTAGKYKKTGWGTCD